MLLTVDRTGVGLERPGALKAAYARTTDGLPLALAQMGAWRDQGMPHFRLPYAQDDFAKLTPIVDAFLADTTDMVVLGVGGSSLGAQALAQLTFWGTPAFTPAQGRPSVHYWENLDGVTLHRALGQLDLRTTRFLVVSKSGATVETLVQTYVVIAALESAGGKRYLNEHVLCIAEPGANPLRKLAQAIGAAVLDHDTALGGRYSVLSVVGLIPAYAMGLYPAAVRKGAAQCLDAFWKDWAASAPAEGAALNVAAMRSGLSQHVLWAYDDRLEKLVLWWRQLWGESLGKKGQGSTPIRALGPVDQHSQLQLYLDGPPDKLISIVTVTDPGVSATVVGERPAELGMAWLENMPVTQITSVQARATAETLAAHGRPVRRLIMPRLDEEAMGWIMMHFMLETMVAAALLGVDPFDQPAVEEGKRLTRRYLGGPA